MAKARARGRSKAAFTLPIAVLLGMAPLASQGMGGYQAGGFKGAAKQMTLALTGFNTDDSKFYPEWLKAGLYPMLVGFGVHWIAGRIGINRALSSARIPLIRI